MTNNYVLDTDVFIDAKNRHYGMDICPGFWQWLLRMRQADRVVSIKAVCDELCQRPTDEDDEDELSKWVKSEGSCLFLPPDPQLTAKLPGVATWAQNHPRYRPAAVSSFFGGADFYLVGFALAHGHIIVTHEKSAPDSLSRIKIPDACSAVIV